MSTLAEALAEYHDRCSSGMTREHANHLAAVVAEWVTSVEAVEVAARAIHEHQEYSTCWDDEQAGSKSRMGTDMRPLGERGRAFYRGLAGAALAALAVQEKGEG